MKILVDLNAPVMDLSDEPDAVGGMKPTKERLGKTLATMLKTSTEGDALKYLCWAIDLYKVGAIEVDESDLNHLIAFVRSHTGAWALVKGQLLQTLTEALAKSKPQAANH